MTLYKMSSGDYGVKIMKKGKDITSSNVLDYIFWSKYPSLNIKQRGRVSLTTTVDEYGEAVEVTTEVNHDFGYEPQFMAFTTSYGSQYLSKFVFNLMDLVPLNFYADYPDDGADIREAVEAYATDKKIVFKAIAYKWSPFFSGNIGIEWTYDIDYLLFMEEAVPLPI